MLLVGPVSLRLSAIANSSPGSSTLAEKRRKGRPPGSGRKQQLASLGEWMNRSAGIAFSPHVITIEPVELSNKHGCFIHHETLKTLILRCTSEHGSSNDSISLFQDIVSKLLSFSQQRPRALCILSGTGTVSSVSLHQPASSTVSVTYEVR